MKGLALRTVVLLIIAIIVMAVALYFLVYITNFDAFFLSNDQRILKQYSSCALAYCASGAGSDEVNAVGCLKSEAGKCVLSCADVENEKYKPDQPNGVPYFKGNDDRKHYCGKDAALEFEFSGVSLGGVVPLSSGEMDDLAKRPEWICKPVKIPFTNFDIDELIVKTGAPLAGTPGFTTSDIQYFGELRLFGALSLIPEKFPENCIMLSKSVTDSRAYANTLIFVSNFLPQLKAATGSFKVAKVASLNRFAEPIRGALTVETVSFGNKVTSYLRGFRAAGQTATKGFQTNAIKGILGSAIAENAGITDSHGSIGLKTKGGCFSGFVYDYLDDNDPPREDLLYAPIIEYQKNSDKIYPSAIYLNVNDKFTTGLTDSATPECTYINPIVAAMRAQPGYKPSDLNDERDAIIQKYVDEHGDEPRYQDPETRDDLLQADAEAAANTRIPKDPIIGVDVFGIDLKIGEEKLLKAVVSGFEFGSMIKDCKFKTTFNGEKIKYMVWANPTFPAVGTLNTIGKFGEGVTDTFKNLVDDLSKFVSSNSSSNIAGTGYNAHVGLKKSLSPVEYAKQSLTIQEALLEASKKDLAIINLNPASTPQQKTDAQNKVDQAQEAVGNATRRLAELQKDEEDPVKNSFSQFGSCAYVTLSRDLPGSIISTPTGSQEIVLGITELSTDKTYAVSDTVSFVGRLEMASGSPAGKQIRIYLIKPTQSDQIGQDTPLGFVDVETDQDGLFKGNIKLTDYIAAGGEYKIQAEYQNQKKEASFAVS